MANKYTFEFIECFVKENSDCKLLSTEYINCKQKLLFQCRCGESFEATFDEFKNGNKRQCNACGFKNGGSKNTKSHQKFEQEIFDLVGNEYSLLTKYQRDDVKVLMKHNKCGYEWNIVPSAFLQGVRCPQCQHRSYKKNTKEFMQEVFDLVGEEYSVLSDYVGCEDYILMKHNICGHIYDVKPHNFLTGKRCPNCALPHKPNTEKKLQFFLEQKGVNHQHHFRFDDCINPKTKMRLTFDFAIFDKDDNLLCLIEYDGKQHFEPIAWFGGEDNLLKQKYRDKIKNEYCQKNNIYLIRIPYWDFSILEEVLEEKLKVVI